MNGTSGPVVIVIPGTPVPKGRGRHRNVKTKDGREFTTTFTPAATRRYGGVIRSFGEAAMRGRTPIEGPIHVAVVLRFRPPQSWPQWKRDAALDGLICHDTKPDSDNVKKAIYDGLNSVAWVDDCQIVAWAGRTEYSTKEAVLIKVTPIAKASSRITRKEQLAAVLARASQL